ncbi:N-acetylneuraminate synthase family protein [Solemya velesiana gill symbiont]|uniref:Uncharacterized protein n=1 Tax=Solemya velesiana gill symbiont TaxID=1918948 RepID=A0A1T2KUH6_9GAMM|nr:N-acetylneuraminate synthase family protein [Solemya velesiana gill symbiont]OOZ36451.1 hypothetical protein BOW51_07140 [Solemya velesiana gill symbiont]
MTKPWMKHAAPYVIAEIGSNHDGELARAIRLIEQVADAGADAAKFQLFRPETFLRPGHPAWDTINRLSVPNSWLPELTAACNANGLDFSATPFDQVAVDALVSAQASFIKIASTDLTYVQLLEQCAASGLPIVLSTGMSTYDEVSWAMDVLRGAEAGDIALMHCVSKYPPDPVDMNLRVIPEMVGRFGVEVGISDHSPGSAVPVAAQALGATLFEKHVTDDRSRSGPDHPYALTLEEFSLLVKDLKFTAQALGNGEKRCMQDEPIKARRGLYAARNIPEGRVITVEDLIGLRPYAEVGAEQVREVIGKCATTAIAKGDAIPAGLLLK